MSKTSRGGPIKRARNGRMALNLWTPRPATGPAIVERGGVVQPAIGTVINSAHESEAARPDAVPPGHIPPDNNAARAGRPRISEFLRRRIPWRAITGGSA